MPSKTLRFPLRTTVKNSDVAIGKLAAEESGYGFCLSLCLLIKPRLQNALRSLTFGSKSEFANSTLLK